MSPAQRCRSTPCFLFSRICRLGLAPSIFRRQLFPSAQVPPGFLLGGSGGGNKAKQMNKGRKKARCTLNIIAAILHSIKPGRRLSESGRPPLPPSFFLFSSLPAVSINKVIKLCVFILSVPELREVCVAVSSGSGCVCGLV